MALFLLLSFEDAAEVSAYQRLPFALLTTVRTLIILMDNLGFFTSLERILLRFHLLNRILQTFYPIQ